VADLTAAFGSANSISDSRRAWAKRGCLASLIAGWVTVWFREPVTVTPSRSIAASSAVSSSAQRQARLSKVELSTVQLPVKVKIAQDLPPTAPRRIRPDQQEQAIV